MSNQYPPSGPPASDPDDPSASSGETGSGAHEAQGDAQQGQGQYGQPYGDQQGQGQYGQPYGEQQGQGQYGQQYGQYGQYGDQQGQYGQPGQYGQQGGQYGQPAQYGQPSPYGAPPAYGYGGFAEPKFSPLAIVSLVTGILGICGCGVFIFGIAGVVTGVIGRKQIKESQGQLKGSGLALAGIIVGGIGLVLGLAYWIVIVANGGMNFSTSP